MEDIGAAIITDRGALLSASEIADRLFGGNVSAEWVRMTIAPDKRRRLGHSTLRWFERDVMEWIEAQRPAA